MQLRPTQVLMFGNPLLGTPLMVNDRRIGNDLPQKVLAYEAANGTVFVAYNDIYFLRERYSMTGDNEVFETISTALENLTNKAVSPN